MNLISVKNKIYFYLIIITAISLFSACFEKEATVGVVDETDKMKDDLCEHLGEDAAMNIKGSDGLKDTIIPEHIKNSWSQTDSMAKDSLFIQVNKEDHYYMALNISDSIRIFNGAGALISLTPLGSFTCADAQSGWSATLTQGTYRLELKANKPAWALVIFGASDKEDEE